MMPVFKTIARKIHLIIVTICVLIFSCSAINVYASTLTSLYDNLSNNQDSATGVTHTLGFTTATSSTLLNITFQFSTTSGGTTKPAGLNLTSSTLGTVTNLNSGWTLDTTNAATGKIFISRSVANGLITINSGTLASVNIQNITNSALGNCITNSGTLSDTCNVTISTYSDTAGTTLVDSGVATYTIIQNPTFSFTVNPVAAGAAHNGITSSVASTATSIQFGKILPGQVLYATQQLLISTNAPNGYTITAYLVNPITGNNTNNTVSPFGAVNATWTTPQLWSTPNGTVKNNNSAWFGANTSDTRVSGWSSNTSSKFGPFSQTANTVAYSSGPDIAGSTIYISYALGTNILQPSDLYTANIIYNVQATY
jgi:hypothetical protein